MKALTLWQPWASFIIAGIKGLETRPNGTSHRGPLAIHAARFPYAELRAMLGDDEVMELEDVCEGHKLPAIACMPRGAILGIVTVVDVADIKKGVSTFDPPRLAWRDRHTTGAVYGDEEQQLGDFREGRCAWDVSFPLALSEPLPWSGKQGLWNLPDEALGDWMNYYLNRWPS